MMHKNGTFDRLPGKPFTNREIELFLLGKADKELSDRIEKFEEESAEFAESLAWYKTTHNPIPFADIEAYVQNHADDTVEESTNAPSGEIPFLEYLKNFLSLLMRPQVQGLLSLCVVLAVVITIIPFDNKSSHDGSEEVYAKGAVAFGLNQNDKAVLPGEEIVVRQGDVLSFDYRSVKDLHVMVLYRDDNKAIAPYIIDQQSADIWKRTITPKVSSKKIRLNDDFVEETIWTLYSESAFSLKEAHEAIRGDAHNASIEIKQYNLRLSK